jgi:murein DD-endopeptidase MepM/ murein hydrolase activator NlpD
MRLVATSVLALACVLGAALTAARAGIPPDPRQPAPRTPGASPAAAGAVEGASGTVPVCAPPEPVCPVLEPSSPVPPDRAIPPPFPPAPRDLDFARAFPPTAGSTGRATGAGPSREEALGEETLRDGMPRGTTAAVRPGPSAQPGPCDQPGLPGQPGPSRTWATITAVPVPHPAAARSPKRASPAPRVYRVRPGDTLERIARKSGSTVDAIVRANRISRSGKRLRAGTRLVIPGLETPPPPPAPVQARYVKVTAAPEAVPEPSQFAPGHDPDARASADPPATPVPGGGPAPPSAGPGFGTWCWPIGGSISSVFGSRHHRLHPGIDLLVPTGTPVTAARAGRVTYAGRAQRYGLLVVVDHGDGTESYYAHLRAIAVRVGDEVAQGDGLGAAGATGNATGPHLHFEIRQGGTPVDPLVRLPYPDVLCSGT